MQGRAAAGVYLCRLLALIDQALHELLIELLTEAIGLDSPLIILFCLSPILPLLPVATNLEYQGDEPGAQALSQKDSPGLRGVRRQEVAAVEPQRLFEALHF